MRPNAFNALFAIGLTILLVIVPALVSNAWSYISSLTEQERHYVMDTHIREILIRWWNETASDWKPETQSWSYDAGNYTIIIPSCSQSGTPQSHFTSIIIVLYNNITGSWLWENRMEQIVITITSSINLTVNNVYLWNEYKPGEYIVLQDMAGSGSHLSLAHRFSYTELAQMSLWTGGQITGLRIFINMPYDVSLNGAYLELKIYWLKTKLAWVSALGDYMLGFIGFAMFFAGIIATPWLSWRQIARAIKRKR